MRRATGCITSCAGCWGNFYPRPPRGGRRYTTRAICRVGKISIHALREEGDSGSGSSAADSYNISIHALREEGDTINQLRQAFQIQFLSTPSARRATDAVGVGGLGQLISIHALREEGDTAEWADKMGLLKISIHALREEGD